MGWVTVIGAIFQVVILLIQAYNKNSQEHSDKVKEISDAIASRDVSSINSVINKLRS